jgi:hypothetical protein
MSIVSFDFDDTLAWNEVIRDPVDGEIEDTVPAGVNPTIMPLLHAALDRGDEVHIVTTRHASRWREDTLTRLREWGVLDRLAGIHFTDGEWKAKTLAALRVQVHHDDDQDELDRLPPGCSGVLAPLHPSWGGVR